MISRLSPGTTRPSTMATAPIAISASLATSMPLVSTSTTTQRCCACLAPLRPTASRASPCQPGKSSSSRCCTLRAWRNASLTMRRSSADSSASSTSFGLSVGVRVRLGAAMLRAQPHQLKILERWHPRTHVDGRQVVPTRPAASAARRCWSRAGPPPAPRCGRRRRMARCRASSGRPAPVRPRRTASRRCRARPAGGCAVRCLPSA